MQSRIQHSDNTFFFMMVGIPGSGKTTASECIADLTGAIHLSADKFRLAVNPQPKFTPYEHLTTFRSLDYVSELFLSKGISLIYDSNLNRRKSRKEKYEMCNRLGVTPYLVWVTVPEEVSRQRALVDAVDDPRRPFGNLKTDVYERLMKNLQVPTDEEPVIRLDGTKLSPEYIKQKLPKETLIHDKQKNKE